MKRIDVEKAIAGKSLMESFEILREVKLCDGAMDYMLIKIIIEIERLKNEK